MQALALETHTPALPRTRCPCIESSTSPGNKPARAPGPPVVTVATFTMQNRKFFLKKMNTALGVLRKAFQTVSFRGARARVSTKGVSPLLRRRGKRRPRPCRRARKFECRGAPPRLAAPDWAVKVRRKGDAEWFALALLCLWLTRWFAAGNSRKRCLQSLSERCVEKAARATRAIKRIRHLRVACVAVLCTFTFAWLEARCLLCAPRYSEAPRSRPLLRSRPRACPL
jgi:hypothetical protein